MPPFVDIYVLPCFLISIFATAVVENCGEKMNNYAEIMHKKRAVCGVWMITILWEIVKVENVFWLFAICSG